MDKKAQGGFTLVEVTVLLIVVLGVGGWIANIVKLVGMNFDHITGLLVVRAIGIFIAPLGAVLGFVPA